jgi:ABC-2 type transport system permease protein
VILATVRAEWFKLTRRSSIWVSIGLMLAIAVGLEYLLVYVVVTHPPQGVARVGANLDTLRAALYPDSLVKKSLSNVSGLYGIFALIIGVLAQGSEYSWGTVKTTYLQVPGRLSIIAGQLVALAALTLVMAGGLLAIDAAASYVIATIDSHPVSWPALDEVLRGAGAAWLVLYFVAVMGFGLATLFRQSAMAIGLGLAYALVIENLVFGLLDNLGNAFQQAQQVFPMANAGYLEDSFGKAATTVTSAASLPPASAMHAIIALAIWTIVLAGVAGALVRLRDIA